MRRVLAAIGIVATMTTLLAMALFGGTAAAGREETLSLRLVTVEEEFLDLGAPGPSLGDAFIFSDEVWRNGSKIGHDGAVCTLTSTLGPQGRFNCVGTFWLPEGQITVQALIEPTGESPETFDVAVTGGTGRYSEADGWARIVESETDARITFHLDL